MDNSGNEKWRRIYTDNKMLTVDEIKEMQDGRFIL